MLNLLSKSNKRIVNIKSKSGVLVKDFSIGS